MRSPRVLLLALLAALVAAPSAPAAERSSYYLSLGTSLANGMQPNAEGDTVATNQGYADVLYTRMRAKTPRLQHIRLGCGGETTTTFVEGGICRYPGGDLRARGKSQLQAAVRFLRAHRGQVEVVTIDMGANDVARCASGGAIDGECLKRGLARLERNLPRIARTLRRAAGPRVKLAAMSQYDPFWQLYLRGDQAGRDTAKLSAVLAAGIRDTTAQAFGGRGFEIADVFGAFETANETLVSFGGQQVPKAVERICALTWMCAPAPRGPNIHARPEGYRVIATAFERALR